MWRRGNKRTTYVNSKEDERGRHDERSGKGLIIKGSNLVVELHPNYEGAIESQTGANALFYERK
jgi:hypothetical protein